MMNRVLIVIAILFSVNAWARGGGGGGDSVGNGGDAMVCGEEVSFFDIYESEVLLKRPVEMGNRRIDPYEKVAMVLARIPEPSAILKEILVNYFEDFKVRSNFGTFDLRDIDDAENVVIKPGCKLQQAVVQQEPLTSQSPRYLIDERLWNLMDNDSKAALILHEIVYRYAIELGHKNSRRVRALNGYLMTYADYQGQECLLLNRMMELKLAMPNAEYVDKDGTLYWQSDSEIQPNCIVTKGMILSGSIEIWNKRFGLVNVLNDNKPHGYAIERYLSGQLKRATIQTKFTDVLTYNKIELRPAMRNDNWKWSSWWAYEEANSVSRPTVISFHENGKLESISVQSTVVPVQQGSLTFTGDLYFDDMGNVSKLEGAPSFDITLGELQLSTVRRMEFNKGVPKNAWATGNSLFKSVNGILFLTGLFFFDENGNFSRANISEGQNPMVYIRQQPVKILDTLVEFHPNGALKQFVLAAATEFENGLGARTVVPALSAVELSPDGFFVREIR